MKIRIGETHCFTVLQLLLPFTASSFSQKAKINAPYCTQYAYIIPHNAHVLLQCTNVLF